MIRHAIWILVFTVTVIVAMTALAGVPHLVNYQGTITDADGPVDGPHDLTFSIYPDSTGGSAFWTEVHTGVNIQYGLFNVILGRYNDIPPDLLDNDELWIAVKIDGDPEIAPRMRITSVAWAMRAAVADTALTAVEVSAHSHHSLDAADGDPTDAIYVDENGNVGIGTTNPQALLQVGEETCYLYRNPNRLGIDDIDPDAQLEIAVPAAGLLDLFMLSSTPAGDGDLFIVENGGNVGIGTAAPASRLEVNGNVEADGVTINGIPVGTSTDTYWSADNGNIYYNAGNVGIGTTTPGSPLHVDGSVSDDGGSAVQVEFDNTVSAITGHGIDAESNTLQISGLQIGVKGVSSVDFSENIGSAEGHLGHVSGWSAGSWMLGVNGISNPSALDNGGPGNTSFAVGGKFLAQPPAGLTLDGVGTYYVGGVYGEVADQVDAGGNAIVAGVIGVDNSTGTAGSYAGYFDGDVKMTGFDMPTGAVDGHVLTSDASGVGSWQEVTGIIGGAGLEHYIAKFTGNSTIGNSVIYETTEGYIGIGPDGDITHMLEVAGDISLDRHLVYDHDEDTYLEFDDNRMALFAGGSNMIDLFSELAPQDYVVINDGEIDVDFRVNALDYPNAIFVRGDNGCVGIGRVPGSLIRLHVGGNVAVDQDLILGEYLYHLGDAGNDTYVRFDEDLIEANASTFRVQTAGVSNALVVDADNGGVGIGTDVPYDRALMILKDRGLASVEEEEAEKTLVSIETDAGTGAGLMLGYYANDVATTGSLIRASHSLPLFLGTSNHQQTVTVTDDGNVGIGTTAPDYKLETTGAIMMENSVTPASQADHSGIYTSGGELYAIDAGGNTTQLSPHDSETGEWIFYSKNVKTGRVVRIDMEKLVRTIEVLTGEKFMTEHWEEITQK